ncbi:MAG: PGPGW domain-containing protein [Bdellovibrionales bacterium]|nr:PGPGW domain-containing protein [Bdellovibrionales bacterium]
MDSEPKLEASRSPRAHVWRLLVLVVGFVVTLFGVVMLVTPGPAFIVIPIGIWILSTEFDWARRLRTKLEQYFAARERTRSQSSTEGPSCRSTTDGKAGRSQPCRWLRRLMT